MAAGTLTTTMARIRNVLRDANISARSFAALLGVPASAAKDALGGRDYVGGEVEAAWLPVAIRASRFAKAFGPHLVCSAEGLRRLLEGDVSPEQVEAAVRNWFRE